MTDEQVDAMIFELIAFFDSYHFYEISQDLIKMINDKSTQNFQIHSAKIKLFFKQYKEVIEICDNILKINKNCVEALRLRGDAYYFLDNLFDSEENYTALIRKMNKEDTFDLSMLYRLGMAYIRRKTWSDAKTVFTRILRINSNYAFGWRNLGLAYMRLEEFIQAEEALNEANLLDIDNPDNWGFLCLFCLMNNRVPQALECLNELKKVKYSNEEILVEIAEKFYDNR